MTDGSIGLGDEPIDKIIAGVDGAGPVPIDDMFGHGVTGYATEFRLETPEGECVVTAKDDTVVIEYSEDGDD